MNGRLLVVGNGMVGHRLVEAVHERDTDRRWQITVVGDESTPAYDRVALSSLFHGTAVTDLHLASEDLYDDDARVRHVGDAAVGLDLARHVVTTASGRALPYDELVLATGSAPFVPPVPGNDLPGVFVYRTLDDVAAIQAYADHEPATPAAARRCGAGSRPPGTTSTSGPPARSCSPVTTARWPG